MKGLDFSPLIIFYLTTLLNSPKQKINSQSGSKLNAAGLPKSLRVYSSDVYHNECVVLGNCSLACIVF